MLVLLALQIGKRDEIVKWISDAVHGLIIGMSGDTLSFIDDEESQNVA